MDIALFSEVFAVTGPVFAMLVAGLVLRRTGLIDAAFIGTASTLSFRVLMPALLFFSILGADLETALQPLVIGYFCLATLLTFAGAWLWSLSGVAVSNRGIYVQGAFRGNCGIVGLALAASQYGAYGLSTGGVMAGIAIVLFNTLSVIVLGIYSPTFEADIRSVIRSLVSNPLIISVVVGLMASAVELTPPQWIMVSGDYFASMTLPLALMCIGGSLSLRSLLDSGRVALSASLVKVLWAPALFTGIAWWLGFESRDLGMLFLFLASPTAAASYVMARAAGSDGKLAANIIVISTMLSMVTIMLGLYLLGHFGLA